MTSRHAEEQRKKVLQVSVQHMGQNRGRAYICQEIFSNVGKKIQSLSRKFQSHPLGDLAICYKHSIVYQNDGLAGTQHRQSFLI